MNINRKQIFESMIEEIRQISSKEYQKRVWILQEGPECEAFDDAVCDFFDIIDPILDEYKDFGLNQSQYVILKKFRDEFELFSANHDFPEIFIDTPEWQKIMERAKEVLKAFNFEKSN